MTTQSRYLKETPAPHPASGNGHAAGSKALPPNQPIPNHPLASVLGSFTDDPATLDGIMAGVEKYRQRMEAEPGSAA